MSAVKKLRRFHLLSASAWRKPVWPSHYAGLIISPWLYSWCTYIWAPNQRINLAALAGKTMRQDSQACLIVRFAKYCSRRCSDFYLWTFCCFQKMFNGSVDFLKKEKHFNKLLCSPLYTSHFQHLHVSNHIGFFFILGPLFHADAHSCSQICTATCINLSIFKSGDMSVPLYVDLSLTSKLHLC